MNWDNQGFLVSKNRYNENSVIAEFFTEDYGKCTGIIFGASSKKLKNYLQIGNKFFINHTFKPTGKIGYFKVEIIEALTPRFFDNQNKLMCIASSMNLIKLLTVELQENKNIFFLINRLFLLLKSKNWLNEYIFWELELLKLIGYHLELNKIVSSEIIDNKKVYFVKSNSEKKIVPNFLIEKTNEENDYIILLKGLKLIGDFLNKNIFIPNNINYPSLRTDFINSLK